MSSVKKVIPLVVIGIMFMVISIFTLVYLTVNDGFLETLFPTGFCAIIIGWLGLRLFYIGRKSKSAQNVSHEIK